VLKYIIIFAFTIGIAAVGFELGLGYVAINGSLW
jgi:hypothetical protein